ncbi:hypothetical protein M514_04855 [Trichuris suis]|uniref:non-specific serine/threonine protein kinase n=1 Tax=Trichuris suis TaxID=68888 RepID=A0A085NUI8_9BILA|nr:hypothetical protein M514_04855 [Trichuris suis]
MSQQQSGPYGNGDWLNHLSSPSSSDSPKLDDRHCYPFPSTSNSVAQPEQNRWSMAKSRYGHQQALDQIKQSLLPYHNAAATTAVTSAGAVSGGSSSSSGLHSTALSATAAAGSSSITPTCPDLATFSLHESAMLDNLVQMGFDKRPHATAASRVATSGNSGHQGHVAPQSLAHYSCRHSGSTSPVHSRSALAINPAYIQRMDTVSSSSDSSGHRLDANSGDTNQCYVNEPVGLGLKTVKNYKVDKAGPVTDYTSANDTNCVLFRKANPRLSDYEYPGCFPRTTVPIVGHEEDRIVREVSALAYYKNRLESIELLSTVEGLTFNQYRGLLNRVGPADGSCGSGSIGQSLGHIPFMSELTCTQVPSDSFYIENLCRRVNNVLSTTKGALTNEESGHGTPLEPSIALSAMALPLCDRISPASSLSTDDSEILVGQESAATSAQSIRCCSPLPESIQMKLQLGAYEFFNVLRPCTPQAFRFYMEQHVENVLKMYKERLNRQMQLEKEMARADFPAQLQCQMRKLLTQKESCYLRLRRQRMDASMFEKIKTIGIGAFGEVALVRKKDTETLFAMKVLRKFDVIKKNQAAHVKAERDILSEADNEWVVKLYYSFQDKDCLFFIMEYIPGGDMMALLIKKGLFEEQLAKFYIAELVCAIHSVHKLGFIHRDIKPDNILIDRNGHIKLTDFGLCTGLRWTHDWKYYAEEPVLHGHKQEDSFDLLQQVEPQYNHKLLDYRHRKQRCKAHSLVGTPNYIAPEVLLRIGHTQLCDWWSVGVIFYEMVVGHPPFLANTPEETQAKVIHWRSSLHIPKGANLSEAATDLILQLCCGPENRLGKDKEAADIKRHPFFQGIDWENLRNVKAPYRPEILHATDTSNFDPVEPRQDMSGDQSAAGIVDHAFYEFTFRRFFDSDGYGCPTLRLSPPRKLDNALQPEPEVADRSCEVVDHSSSSLSRTSDNKNVLRISTGT